VSSLSLFIAEGRWGASSDRGSSFTVASGPSVTVDAGEGLVAGDASLTGTSASSSSSELEA
jgi:hypothetical protein